MVDRRYRLVVCSLSVFRRLYSLLSAGLIFLEKGDCSIVGSWREAGLLPECGLFRFRRRLFDCLRRFIVKNRQTARSPLAVNDFAADDRGFHFHVANGFRFQLKDVVTHYDHVCEFAR